MGVVVSNREREKEMNVFKKARVKVFETLFLFPSDTFCATSVWPDGKIIFQYLAFYIDENFPQWHTKFAKVGPKIFPKIKNLPKIAQDFEDFAAVVKFRKNRSHWQPYLGKCMWESVMCKSEAEHETVCVCERESSILTLCLLSI